jgi:hypothetical protein
MLLGVTLQVHCIMIKITRKVTPLTDTPDKVAVIAGFLGWMTSPLKSEEMWTAKRGDARV